MVVTIWPGSDQVIQRTYGRGTLTQRVDTCLTSHGRVHHNPFSVVVNVGEACLLNNNFVVRLNHCLLKPSHYWICVMAPPGSITSLKAPEDIELVKVFISMSAN